MSVGTGGTDDVAGCIHYASQSLTAGGSAVSIPNSDDTLSGYPVEGAHDVAWVLSPSHDVVHPQELGAADHLHSSTIEGLWGMLCLLLKSTSLKPFLGSFEVDNNLWFFPH